MRAILAWILGLSLAANGVIMLAVPAAWYMAVPGVSATGPFNAHRAAPPAALAGAAFLALHALVHVWDAAAGREAAPLFEAPSVFMPPALAIWIAWPRARDTTKQRRVRC